LKIAAVTALIIGALVFEYGFDGLSPIGLLLAVFMVSFAESLAVVGLLIPGVGLLLSLTLVAVSVQISPLHWFVAGTLGAFLGDGVSFWLGQKSGHTIRHWRFFQRHPHWLKNAQQFFYRYGVWSIALGRFIGPIRPVVPLVAGAMKMQPRIFWTANALSAPAWGCVYLLGMYWLGEEFLSVVDGPRLLAILVGASVVAVIVSWLAQRRS
jgi:membrane protein DedA with SNARE-associated domain